VISTQQFPKVESGRYDEKLTDQLAARHNPAGRLVAPEDVAINGKQLGILGLPMFQPGACGEHIAFYIGSYNEKT